MPSEDETKRQLERLEAHRLTLHHYLLQRAKLGAAYVPPGVTHGIAEARREIQQIRNRLLARGYIAASHPDDEDEQLLKSTELPSSFIVTNSQQAPDHAQPDSDGHARAVGDTSLLQAASEEPEKATSAVSEPPNQLPSTLPVPSSNNIPRQPLNQPPPDQPTELSESALPNPEPFFVMIEVGTEANEFDLTVTITRKLGDPLSRKRTDPSPALFTLPFDWRILPNKMSTLSDWKRETFAKLHELRWLDPGMAEQQKQRKFGLWLFESIFSKPEDSERTNEFYEAHAKKAKLKNKPVRIFLRLPTELEVIPWEMLWCPEVRNWFTIDPMRDVLRVPDYQSGAYSISKRTKTTKQRPLRVVVILAVPNNISSHGSLQQEAKKHKEILDSCYALLKRGTTDVIVEYIDASVTLQQLERRLVTDPNPIDILHIFGHGELIGDEAFIEVESTNRTNTIESDSTHLVSGLRLCSFVRQRHSNNKQAHIRLVVLNTCFSANTHVGALLKSLATELIQADVASVIAMQGQVTTEIAHQLTHDLYRSLWQGKAVDQALTEVRKNIFDIVSDPKSQSPVLEWPIPVLLVHPSISELKISAAFATNTEKSVGVTIEAFLVAHGLHVPQEQQFMYHKAQMIDDERIQRTFVLGPLKRNGLRHPNGNHIDELLLELTNGQAFIFMAPEGFGKTSYLRRIKFKIDIEQKKYAVAHIAGADIQDWDAESKLCDWYIRRRVYASIMDFMKRNELSISDLEPDKQNLIEQMKSGYSQVKYDSKQHIDSEGVKLLAEIAKECGCLYLYIFIEDDGVSIGKMNKIVIEVLRLMNDYKELCFKVFIAQNNKIVEEIRKSGIIYYQIGDWGNEHLRDIVRALFAYLGETNDGVPTGSLHSICDLLKQDDFAGLSGLAAIEERIFTAAQGSPRTLIHIINDLIREHCQIAVDARQNIGFHIVDQVLLQYEAMRIFHADPTRTIP